MIPRFLYEKALELIVVKRKPGTDMTIFNFPITWLHHNKDSRGLELYTFGNIFGMGSKGFLPEEATSFVHLSGKKLKDVELVGDENGWTLKAATERTE